MLEAKQKIIEGLISYGSKKMRDHPTEKFKNKFDFMNESVSYAMSNEVNIPSDLEEQIEWHVKNYDFDDFDVVDSEHDLTEPVSDEEYEKLHNKFFEQ
jgi:uncharacterized radical SAM superfamily protein